MELICKRWLVFHTISITRMKGASANKGTSKNNVFFIDEYMADFAKMIVLHGNLLERIGRFVAEGMRRREIVACFIIKPFLWDV